MARQRSEATPPRPYFGRWLHAQLKAAGWTGADLAEAVGVRRMSVTYWATGVFTPRPTMVEGIAAFLAIPPEAVRAALAHGDADQAEPVPIVVTPYTPPARPFPRWLRERLAERGWSGDAFGRRAGADGTEVDHWRAGRKVPSPAHVAAIAVALGVEASFVGGLAYGGNTAYRVARGWRPPPPAAPVGER
jgi:transcriptional regulator with XRE-family HTH domain